MILGAHVIISAYGFWLPNDQRGSWSDFVRKWELYRDFGPATKVETTRSVAKRPFNASLRDAAKRSLKYPQVWFNGRQAQCIGLAFGEFSHKSGCAIHACSILPGHTHLVIGRHDYRIQQVVNLLKGAATRRLTETGFHPLRHFASPTGAIPSPWARDSWDVFLDSDEAVYRAIRYVDDNPLKERKRRQNWSFVAPYPFGF